MSYLASFPMYDFAEVRDHTDALWKAVAHHLGEQGLNAPDTLTRSNDLWDQWLHKDLIFSQTCGYPFVTKLRGQVTLVGTPDYGVVPERPGWYYSVILCRADDKREQLSEFAGARWAYNDIDSQSGCHAMMFTLQQMLGDDRHFETCVATGGHRNSVQAVFDSTADIAAIDIVTWQHLKRDAPSARNLRVLMETSPTPGLPYICARQFDGKTLAEAFRTALRALPAPTQNALFLKGFWASQESDYDLIAERAALSASVFAAHFRDEN